MTDMLIGSMIGCIVGVVVTRVCLWWPNRNRPHMGPELYSVRETTWYPPETDTHTGDVSRPRDK